jgi:hypothetical protein
MKTKIKIGTMIALAAALFAPRMEAQVTNSETVVEQRTVVQEPAKAEMPPLRTVELGARYMPTFTTMSFKTSGGETVTGAVTMSQGYGGMLGINFTKNVGLQAEVTYNEVMQKYKDNNLERQVDINYLNIPVMLSLNTNKRQPVNLNLVAGPQFGLNVGSEVHETGSPRGGETVQATVAAKPGDIGLAYGAGLEFALDRAHHVRFDIGYRGMYGFADIGAKQVGPGTYNIFVKGSRRTNAGYAGLTFCF